LIGRDTVVTVWNRFSGEEFLFASE